MVSDILGLLRLFVVVTAILLVAGSAIAEEAAGPGTASPGAESVGSPNNLGPSEGTLYTACNIWIHEQRGNIKCINYKNGTSFIPAGTKVKDLKIESGRYQKGSVISFSTAQYGPIQIGFDPRWHPGKTIEDYKDAMFSTENFEVLTKGMSQDEVAAIKDGILVEGMSKKAVIISYGFPPEHVTDSLDNNKWMYWMNKFIRKEICFDENGLTIDCESLKTKRKQL